MPRGTEKTGLMALTGSRALAGSKIPTAVRRRWQKRLLDKQEVIEKAVVDLEDEVLLAYDGGMSFAVVGGILGLHPTTVKDIYERADKRRAESGSAGSE